MDLLLLHLLICEMGMIYVSIQHTIRFSVCKISDIGCAPPSWTVSIRWYSYYVDEAYRTVGRNCRYVTP